MHETSDFVYSIIMFSFTKYFEHSYTVDVVFTLSYMYWFLKWMYDCTGNKHNITTTTTKPNQHTLRPSVDRRHNALGVLHMVLDNYNDTWLFGFRSFVKAIREYLNKWMLSFKTKYMVFGHEYLWIILFQTVVVKTCIFVI